jgi:hypothetical protein
VAVIELVVENVYKCRNRWHYLIPVETTDRQALKHLCQSALDFGNHFLGIYQDFLLNELRHEQLEVQLRALKSLKRIVYPNNQAIISMVNQLKQSSNEKIREAAIAAGTKIAQVSKS